ncbi:Receptor-type tyrosine-protein phosphatase eta [Chelonia mydas]|uniref:Receptor-type tyrosine-protein phosphatase eta n=1 Tax=Chelonia mydas TaxID=8469 RepID=M7BCV1_CHEMY|nr:Receptor-type tyrosine-protein phosphatase eta [Chelonia mydas]
MPHCCSTLLCHILKGKTTATGCCVVHTFSTMQFSQQQQHKAVDNQAHGYYYCMYKSADNKTEGDPNSASIYTMPSPVFNIKVSNVSTDKVSLTWENKDAAAFEYSYRVLIENKTSPTGSVTVSAREAVIAGLNPGTFYNFTIFPLAADNKTEGDPNSVSICTSQVKSERVVSMNKALPAKERKSTDYVRIEEQ